MQSSCQEQTSKELKVVLPYASTYSNTATIQSAIAVVKDRLTECIQPGIELAQKLKAKISEAIAFL